MANHVNLGMEFGSLAPSGQPDGWVGAEGYAAYAIAGYASAGGNLLLYSDDISNGAWLQISASGTGANDAGGSGPVPGTTADQFSDGIGLDTHGLKQSVTVPGVVSVPFSVTLSCFLKVATGSPISWAILYLLDGSDATVAWFDLANGTVGSVGGDVEEAIGTPTIEDFGGGWYLCTMRFRYESAGPYEAGFAAASTDGSQTYTGTGVPVLDVYGPNLAIGPAPAPYSITTGSQEVFADKEWEDFEALWSDVEDYRFTLTDGKQPIAAKYDQAPLPQQAFEDFENWSSNEGYEFVLTSPTSAAHLVSENLLTRSEELDDVTAWSPGNVTVSADAVAAPPGLGGTVAEQIVETAAGNTRYAVQSVAAFTGSGRYTFSAYLRAENRNWASLGTLNDRQWFDLVNGSVGGSTGTVDGAGIEPVGSDWFRCWMTVLNPSVEEFLIAAAEADLDDFFVGVASQAAFDAFGAQLTRQDSPGPYVQTTSAAITTADGERFESFWDRNEFFLSAFDPTIHLTVAGFVGTPGDVENFEEQWDSNQGYLADWAAVLSGPGATTANYDSTPEPFEDFEENFPTLTLTTV